jgi:hypothetical protein
MYFWSPSSTRLAFGPGRAVLILGPTAGETAVTVIVLAVVVLAVTVSTLMEASEATVSSRLLVVDHCSLGTHGPGSGLCEAEANQTEDEGINRYRRGWDADATANSPDSAADTLSSAASTRPNLNKADANWDSSAASQTIDITD